MLDQNKKLEYFNHLVAEWALNKKVSPGITATKIKEVKSQVLKSIEFIIYDHEKEVKTWSSDTISRPVYNPLHELNEETYRLIREAFWGNVEFEYKLKISSKKQRG